jgi:hypothetical protein
MPRNDDKPRVRKTPNGRHLYSATLKGYATYGWGNTPDEARAKLREMLVKYDEVRVDPTYSAAALPECDDCDTRAEDPYGDGRGGDWDWE